MTFLYYLSNFHAVSSQRFKASGFPFGFSVIERVDANREIDSLDTSRVIQQNDILVKIIKTNHDIFPECIMHNFYEGISITRFPDILKNA